MTRDQKVRRLLREGYGVDDIAVSMDASYSEIARSLMKQGKMRAEFKRHAKVIARRLEREMQNAAA